ncbi:hypothetical protein ABTZ93_06590 [Streptomyces sp. NPDC097941]|uniref:hypothetical protein n=1 Tax=Streptomyces sp. NPDC097941 TaxID=3155685 RepID=UPI00331AA848
MGIRMLHRRAGPGRTQAQAHADRAPSGRRSPVPVHATAASTARIPFDLATLLRRTRGRVRLTTLRHAATERDAALWAELALSYLALALTLLPRSRPMPTMTVFIAAVDAVSERAGDRPLPGRRAPGPGATA